MLRLFFFLNLVFLPGLTMAQSQEMKRLQLLERRLDDIENRQIEFQGQWIEGRGQVRSFFSNAVSFGGFFESALTNIDGPDSPAQTSANSNLLGLNVSAELYEHFQFVTQLITALSYTLQNPHNNPTLTPSQRQFGTPVFGAIVAQGYAEYTHNQALKFQAGLGYVPYGYTLQQREPVLLRNRSGSQIASTSGARNIGVAFPLWMGVHILGSFPIEADRFGYNLYTFSPSTSPGSLGAGARLWFRNHDQITYGVSGQMAKDVDDPYQSLGFDISGKINRIGWVAEYAKSRVLGRGVVTESYYFEPYLTFMQDKFLLFVSADWLDNEAYTSVRGGAAVPDPIKKWRTGIGINWIPTSFVRTRAAFLIHDYQGDTAEINQQNRDYQSIDLSVGVTF